MALRRLAVPLVCAACGLSVAGIEPEGSDGGAAGFDAAPANESGAGADPLDASPDASPPPEDGGPTGGPHTIASAGSVAAPTGYAQQSHLIYAEGAKRWWLFTIDSDAPTALAAWSSADFATWTKAEALTLPRSHQKQGANFSVAYAMLGGHDVVHLAIGLPGDGFVRTHYHARAVITATAIAWTTASPIQTIDDSLVIDPEGPATVITAAGRVTDFTGWAPYNGIEHSTGNQNAYVSQATDNGGAWSNAFGGRVDIETVTRSINARAALPLGGESVLAIWESADDEPDPSWLRWSRNNGSGWSPPGSLFSSAKFGIDDWGATALGSTDAHAVRYTDKFEHRRYDGTGWSNGDAIPSLSGGKKKNSGLVVLHDASRVLVATIANDASVQTTSWDAANHWTAWKTAAAATSSVGRSSLSGWSSPTAGVGLVWTESAGTTTSVAGVRVAP